MLPETTKHPAPSQATLDAALVETRRIAAAAVERARQGQRQRQAARLQARLAAAVKRRGRFA